MYGTNGTHSLPRTVLTTHFLKYEMETKLVTDHVNNCKQTVDMETKL